MTKDNKNKATLLMLLCVWPGFLLLANNGYFGWIITIAYLLWLTITVFIGRLVLQDKSSVTLAGTITPIYDLSLKNIGFQYNVQNERWQIGVVGAPCLVFYNPPSSNSVPNMIECYNFVSGNDEHLVRLVHSIEEIKFVLNSCGITDEMIEKSQKVWNRI